MKNYRKARMGDIPCFDCDLCYGYADFAREGARLRCKTELYSNTVSRTGTCDKAVRRDAAAAETVAATVARGKALRAQDLADWEAKQVTDGIEAENEWRVR